VFPHFGTKLIFLGNISFIYATLWKHQERILPIGAVVFWQMGTEK
jgi:hypothetical protein